jgi:hypothetical protein
MTDSLGRKDRCCCVQHHLVILSASAEGGLAISTYNSEYRVQVTGCDAILLTDI